ADLGQPKDGGRIVAIRGNADDAVTQAESEERLGNAWRRRYDSRRLRECSQRQQQSWNEASFHRSESIAEPCQHGTARRQPSILVVALIEYIIRLAVETQRAPLIFPHAIARDQGA